MPKLRRVKGAETIRAFEMAGFSVVRIKGSYHIMSKDGHPTLLSVPVHGAQLLKSGTLRGLIKAAGLSVQEFSEFLK